MKTLRFDWEYDLLDDINKKLERQEKKNIVTSIRFDGNTITMSGLKTLFDTVLPQFPNIQHLSFSDTNIGNEELKYLFNNIPTLKSLSLQNNMIFHKTMQYFPKLSSEFLANLEELYLDGNDFMGDSIYFLSQTFYKMKKLKILSLSNCQLSSNGFLSLGQNIHLLENLEMLKISRNHCSVTVFLYLLQQLPKQKLKELYIHNIVYFHHYNINMNKVSNQTSFYLQQCYCLETLKWNFIMDTNIYNTLLSLPQLKHLFLFDCDYNQDILDEPQKFNHLETIFIDKYSENNLQMFLQSFTKCLKSIRIQRIFCTYPLTFKLLSSVLQDKSDLFEMEYIHLGLSDKVFKNILQTMMIYNRNLHFVNFSNNNISEKLILCFFQNISRWKKMSIVHFDGNNKISNKFLKSLIKVNHYPMNISVGNTVSTNDTFFKTQIKQLQEWEQELNTNFTFNKKMGKCMNIIEKRNLFTHKIRTFSVGYYRIIDEYNSLLLKMKKIVKNKKNFLYFSNWLENSKKEYILHQKDIQCLLYQYL